MFFIVQDISNIRLFDSGSVNY